MLIDQVGGTLPKLICAELNTAWLRTQVDDVSIDENAERCSCYKSALETGFLPHLLLEVICKHVHILDGLEVVAAVEVASMRQQRQVLRHLAPFDRIHTDLLESLTVVIQARVGVKLGSVG